MGDKLYRIPPIVWQPSPVNPKQSLISTNTIIKYTIQSRNGYYYVFYGNGRAKEFKTLEDAQYWVQNIHYKAKISKYLEEVTNG